MNDRKLQGAQGIYTNLTYSCCSCGSLRDFLKVETFGQRSVGSPGNEKHLCELQREAESSGDGLRGVILGWGKSVGEKLFSWIVGSWALGGSIWEGRKSWEAEWRPHPLPPLPLQGVDEVIHSPNLLHCSKVDLEFPSLDICSAWPFVRKN